jgi:hypothetical protein
VRDDGGSAELSGTYRVVMRPRIDADPDTEMFDAPEDAALAGWRSTPSAHARVIRVEEADAFDGLYVTVETDGHPGFHDTDIASVIRTPDGKWWLGGSTGG